MPELPTHNPSQPEPPPDNRGDNRRPNEPLEKRGPGPDRPGSGPGGKPSRSLFGMLAVVSIAILFILIMSPGMSRGGAELTWKEFAAKYEAGQIDKASVRYVQGWGVRATTRGSTAGDANEQPSEVIVRTNGQESFTKKLDDLTASDYKVETQPVWQQALWTILPFLLIAVLLWVLFIRGLRSATGGPGGMLGNFGKSRHRVLQKEKTGITFADVAGIDEARSEVDEIVQFLKNPKKFTKLGGRIPRGVLLVGNPGCGKTLLAKAIAGEADVPFFSISGSDFVEMFVGVGASRVRDLFKQAKESAPCIIFLDEIDAVGRRRGGGFNSGGSDEREQTLNAILVEMDGFATGDGIIVIAATNRADVLDPALTRPGRFDRQITVPLPDVRGRLEILKVHAKGKKLGPNVNLERVARATPTFSGADLMAIMNEAAIAATLADKDFIEHEDLEEARDKIRFGRANKSRIREADDNRSTAYHEAGHAVLNVLLKDADPLHKVTIIPRGPYGGASFSLPERDRHGFGLKWLSAFMRISCGGRIAELRATGDISSGASADITSATRTARVMIEEWGMSPKLGFVRYAGEDTNRSYIPEKNYSDTTAKIIDEEVKRLVDEAYTDAERLLDENWDKVEAVAQALIKHETLDAADVLKLMRGEPIGKPSISDMLAAEARKARPTPAPSLAQDDAPQLPPGTLPNPA